MTSEFPNARHAACPAAPQPLQPWRQGPRAWHAVEVGRRPPGACQTRGAATCNADVPLRFNVNSNERACGSDGDPHAHQCCCRAQGNGRFLSDRPGGNFCGIPGAQALPPSLPHPPFSLNALLSILASSAGRCSRGEDVVNPQNVGIWWRACATTRRPTVSTSVCRCSRVRHVRAGGDRRGPARALPRQHAPAGDSMVG